MADPLARVVNRKRPTEVVRLAADPADAERIRAALDPDEAADLLAEVVTIDFDLEAVVTQLDDLMAEHPPTAAQAAAAEREKRQPDRFDMSTFAPALLAATCTRVAWSDQPEFAKPGLTVAEATDLWRNLTDGDRSELFLAALQLCRTSSRVADLGKG